MSDTLTDTSSHDSTGPGTAASGAEDAAHGRHRGHTAPDDNPRADAHGRHRLAADDQH